MDMKFLFFKQKTAYELRISDWSSDVCSSDLQGLHHFFQPRPFKDFIQAVERQVDAVIGHAALREIIGANPFRSVARTDHRLARARTLVRQPLALQFEQIGRASCRERVCQYV